MARKPRKDPKEAADAAEKRAKGAPKARTTKAPKTSPAVAAAKTNPDTDLEAKALFLQNLTKVADLKGKLNTANANLRNAYKTAKADGFLKKDFDVAFEIQGAEGEKKKKAAIARELTIAKWLGCDLGEQLDMFLEPSRVPAEDRAYEEGQTASMTGKSATPSYHPATPQHAAYMKGYHDHQATLSSGFKKLEPKEGDADYGTGVPGTPKKPSNVVAMTRAEAEQQKLN